MAFAGEELVSVDSFVQHNATACAYLASLSDTLTASPPSARPSPANQDCSTTVITLDQLLSGSKAVAKVPAVYKTCLSECILGTTDFDTVLIGLSDLYEQVSALCLKQRNSLSIHVCAVNQPVLWCISITAGQPCHVDDCAECHRSVVLYDPDAMFAAVTLLADACDKAHTSTTCPDCRSALSLSFWRQTCHMELPHTQTGQTLSGWRLTGFPALPPSTGCSLSTDYGSNARSSKTCLSLYMVDRGASWHQVRLHARVVTPAFHALCLVCNVNCLFA